MGLSLPASYGLGAATLILLVLGGALLGASLTIGGRVVRSLAGVAGVGLAIGLFTLFVKAVHQ